MSITAITIENFKGIKDPVRIELKPITLLFGPNSAGKSTIIQALHYAREIFEHHNLNADKTMVGGDNLDLGGFENFVHNHETNQTIRLRFDFRLDSDSADSFPFLANGFREETEESEHFLNFYWTMAEDVLDPWLEVAVRWSSLLGKPIVSSFKTGFGDRLFAEITASEDGKRLALTYLDLQSPVFIFEEGENFCLPWFGPAILDEGKNILQLNIDGRSAIPGRLDRFPDLQEWHPNGMPDIPIFRELDTFKALLSSLLLSPVEYIRDQLKLFRYVGPLRKVPERGYSSPLTPSLTRWSDGLAAWDELNTQDASFIDKVNDWLLSRLNSGYSVELKQYKEVDVTSSFALSIQQGHYLDEELNLQQQFASWPIKRRLLLREESRGIEVAPADIGVGISQILPVIVLALAFQHGVLAIEQPELHIHPALQVALGDLFIEEINSENNINGGKIFLLETHSEHLMLRLLRRIRETGEGETSKDQSLTPAELSIYFIEQGQAGISCLPIRVGEDGDFIDRWPKGFFAERAGELFS